MSDIVRSAFLISDDEYLDTHAEFEQYLIKRGVRVVHYVGAPPAVVERALEDYLGEQEPIAVSLISYLGHGSAEGWHTNNTTEFIPYARLSQLIQEYQHGYLKICASTCYGHRLIGRLIMDGHTRENTCVYTEQFKGNQAHAPSLVGKLLKAWTRRRFVIERETSMTEDANAKPAFAYMVGVQGYGPSFDHHFW